MRIAAMGFALGLLVGCRASTPLAPPRPLPPPPARVAAAVAIWGDALAARDDMALDAAEDRDGRVALLYVAVKAAADQHPDGAAAVEATVVGTVVVWALMTYFPGLFGAYPEDDLLLVLPAGRLGPALVEAGIAESAGARTAIVPLPWTELRAAVDAAEARHRERLRAAEAWTCGPVEIVHTIPASEPTLVRAATLSANVFGGWLGTTDAVWIARADCARGRATFLVTGHPRGTDRVLVAALAP